MQSLSDIFRKYIPVYDERQDNEHAVFLKEFDF